MNDIIKKNDSEAPESSNENTNIVQVSENLLADVRKEISSKNSYSVPIAELSTMGAAISSLIPTVTEISYDTQFAMDGLYMLANQSVGDVLKVAKNGNFWGSFKTAGGKSKLAQLQSAGPVSATTTSKAVTAINPATIMMAVALFSIEMELSQISNMQKQILSFLETEKESEIEADVQFLTNMIEKYKSAWDNDQFVKSNHNLVLDIQRTARKNMISYEKTVNDIIKSKHKLVGQSKVHSVHKDLDKKFKYYRLSLYTYSLASMLEIMLSGNFKEEYIAGIKDEISSLSENYRDLYANSSVYLEKIGNGALDTNILKGIGIAGNSVGKFIGNIPVVKAGPVDELLKDGGTKLKNKAIEMDEKAVLDFAGLSNPETAVFVDKMEDMIEIYNRTENIYFDDKQIYLVTEAKQ